MKDSARYSMRRCSGMRLKTELTDFCFTKKIGDSEPVRKQENRPANASLFSWPGIVDVCRTTEHVFQQEYIYIKSKQANHGLFA